MTPFKSAVALLLGLLMMAGAIIPVPVAEARPKEDDEQFALSVVVKLEPHALPDVLLELEGTTGVEPLIPSRGIYRATSDLFGTIDKKGDVKLHGDAKKWDKDIAKLDGVLWAEPDLDVTAGDTRFHSWQFRAMSAGTLEYTDALASADQPAFAELELPEIHQTATGDGVRIAILDTGVDKYHELLIGRVAGEYDLVDDDYDASEVQQWHRRRRRWVDRRSVWAWHVCGRCGRAGGP